MCASCSILQGTQCYTAPTCFVTKCAASMCVPTAVHCQVQQHQNLCSSDKAPLPQYQQQSHQGIWASIVLAPLQARGFNCWGCRFSAQPDLAVCFSSSAYPFKFLFLHIAETTLQCSRVQNHWKQLKSASFEYCSWLHSCAPYKI